MNDMRMRPKGRPLAIAPEAESASRAEPAFIAKPEGAPVYHGFQVLDDVVVDGFQFGKITDFEAEPSQEGDAFIVAPDNSRAGLVWEVTNKVSLTEISPLEPSRWGVWAVSFPHPMNSRENVRRNLELILPTLKEKWNEWRKKSTRRVDMDQSSFNEHRFAIIRAVLDDQDISKLEQSFAVHTCAAGKPACATPSSIPQLQT